MHCSTLLIAALPVVHITVVTTLPVVRRMAENLQLPTLSQSLPPSEDGGLESHQTNSDVVVANDKISGNRIAGNATNEEGAEINTMMYANGPNDETNTSINNSTTSGRNDLDVNDTALTLTTNMLPQMNVYILDDTPSVASQPPLPLTPVKDIAALESEPYSGLLRTSPYKEPDTTLSLDKEEPVSDLDKSPPSDADRRTTYSPYGESHHASHSSLMMISARADPDDPHRRHNNDDEEEDSSNDDSSYFASHLPEPNSGRRYSWASNASQNSTTRLPQPQPPLPQPQFPNQTHRHKNIHGRESDASLSLSDDSDDHNNNNNNNMAGPSSHPVMFGPQLGVMNPSNQHYYQQQQQQQYNYFQQQQQQQTYPVHPGPHEPPVHFQPLHHQQQQQQQHPLPQNQFAIPPARTGGVVPPELYPEQIMPRMHSVNSLASTSSQNSSGSDTSLQDELQNVVTSQQQRRLLIRGSSHNSHLPSGRRSPILGEHPPSRGASQHLALPPFGSPSSVNLQPSPPTILHSFSAGTATNGAAGDGNEGNVMLPHPQPHSMTAEELAAWTVAATQSHPNFNNNADPHLAMFGGEPPTPASTLPSSFPSIISASRGESDFAYSGDSDSHIHRHHQQQQHQQFKHAFGEPNRGKNIIPKDEQNLRSSSWDQSLGPFVGGDNGGFGTEPTNAVATTEDDRGFKVYWQRWIMLMVRILVSFLFLSPLIFFVAGLL